MEIRLAGRGSEESEGEADGARSLLTGGAVDRRDESEGWGTHSQETTLMNVFIETLTLTMNRYRR